MEHHGFESYYVLGEGLLGESGPGRTRTLSDAAERATPPFRFSRMGPSGANLQLLDANRKKVAAAMTAAPSAQSNVPAGYTYLGQFIDHDLTFDKTSVTFGAFVTPAQLVQARSPSLDLDSLYGAGPQDPVSAKFYEADGLHLKMGATVTAGDAGRPKTDLPRAGTGSNNAAKRKAVIPDPRNDENLAVAQTHLAMIRFHNRVVDTLPASVPAAQKFATARDIVTRHYQWMIRTDFLPRLVKQRPITDVFTNGRKAFEVGATPTDVPTMPIEFSVAAYRLGHSMIRSAYNWNKNFEAGGGTLDFLFTFSGLSGDLGGNLKLPANWVADFRRLYDFGEVGRNDLVVPAAKFNRAMRIDTKLVEPARVPTNANGQPAGEYPGQRPAAEPRLPQPDARADGQAGDWPADAPVPEEQGRRHERPDEGAAPRRQRRRRARRAHGDAAGRVPQEHPPLVLHPPGGRAEQRQAARRRRPDRRGDVAPGDGGEHVLDRP